MSLLTNAVIHEISKPVVINSDISIVVSQMKEVLQNGGVGIAAPQIGILQQIVLCKINGEWITMINPSWVAKGTERKVSKEGCLSFEGFADVKKNRFYRIVVSYLDENYNKQELKLSGLASFIVQHECDHLIGKTIY